MSSYEVLTSAGEVTRIINTPMRPRFPKAEMLSLVGFIVAAVAVSFIWPHALIAVVLMLPLWMMVALGFILFPLMWLISAKKNHGKGQTEITLSDGFLKVEAKGKEILNVDVEQISSIRTGNIHEKFLENINNFQKLFGLHRLSENMYYLEARFRGKTQIIAWGMDEPSADGLLHELGFTEPR